MISERATTRRRNPAVWHTLNRLLMLGIGVVLLVFVALAFRPEWNRRKELTMRLDAERDKLAAEQLLQRQRLREVELLQHDPEYVEMIARDKLGVMKEGETIFRLEPAKADAASAPAPVRPSPARKQAAE